MEEYKYHVMDDQNKIPTKEFTCFKDALAHAKNGLTPFIYKIKIVDEVEDPDSEELVWNWDDIWDNDDEVIARVAPEELISTDKDYTDQEFAESLKDKFSAKHKLQ